MIDVNKLVEKAKSLQDNIAADVWPDGWDCKCSSCGKVTHYTTAECGYYLRHGWPRCECKTARAQAGAKEEG